MRMSHIYQPVMLKVLLEGNGTATLEDIANGQRSNGAWTKPCATGGLLSVENCNDRSQRVVKEALASEEVLAQTHMRVGLVKAIVPGSG